MSKNSENRWLDHFRAQGYSGASRIAAGMEGLVYSLVPGELVAKVWFRKGNTHVECMAEVSDLDRDALIDQVLENSLLDEEQREEVIARI